MIVNDPNWPCINRHSIYNTCHYRNSMELLQVTAKEYGEIINHPRFVYESAEFNRHNSGKCDSVYYLLLKDDHYRMGIIGGVRNNMFYSPFSAPFGGFSFLREDLRLTYIDEALDLLVNWTRSHHLYGIFITLHPYFKEGSQLSKLINCLYRRSFNIVKVDLDYFYNLEKFDESYSNRIWKEGRNNLRKSLLNQLVFDHCTGVNDKLIAFDIIRRNKEEHNYPLHMNFDQIIETSNIIECDFFLVRDVHSAPIASAIVFHVSSEIVQIIYWGDLRKYCNLKPMNFMAYKIFGYYMKLGKKIVDLGPSTSDSVPNYGLCVFKESIGCDVSTKFSYSISF